MFLILLSCSLFSTLPYPLYSPNSDLSLDYKSTSPTITPLALDPGSSLTHGHVLSSTSNIRSIRGITDWYHNAIILSDSNFLCCLLYTIFSELLVYSFDSAFLISPCTYLVRACTLLMSKYIVGKKLSEDILHRSSSAFEGGPLPFWGVRVSFLKVLVPLWEMLRYLSTCDRYHYHFILISINTFSVFCWWKFSFHTSIYRAWLLNFSSSFVKPFLY